MGWKLHKQYFVRYVQQRTYAGADLARGYGYEGIPDLLQQPQHYQTRAAALDLIRLRNRGLSYVDTDIDEICSDDGRRIGYAARMKTHQGVYGMCGLGPYALEQAKMIASDPHHQEGSIGGIPSGYRLSPCYPVACVFQGTLLEQRFDGAIFSPEKIVASFYYSE